MAPIDVYNFRPYKNDENFDFKHFTLSFLPMTLEPLHFFAVTSLIHDLANNTAHYNTPQPPPIEHWGGSKLRAQLLLSLSNIFVRDQELVVTAARLSVAPDPHATFRIDAVICSHSVEGNGGDFIFDPGASEIVFQDVLEFYAR